MTGVNLIGMPFGLHGLGLELRDKARALVQAGVDVCIVNANYSSLRREIRDPEIEALVVDAPVHDINLICHNLPAIGLIARKTPEFLEGRYNIGSPYWEFPELPESHLPGLQALDEVWVSNRFLGACFAGHTERPVVHLPLHLDPPAQVAPRAPGPLVFGYVFDFNSMAARKDPVALLAAFLDRFGDSPETEVLLRIKYGMEPSHLVRPRDVEVVQQLAAGDPRIELIDRPLSNTEMADFYDSLDVYVSPHRTEGLGRGVIEAMMRGRAVIATAYSGPAEFLDSAWSVPLGYYLTRVGAAALGDIRSHFTWAEAHFNELGDALEAYAANPGKAVTHGRTARETLMAGHGARHYGLKGRERLDVIAGDWRP